MKRHAKSLRCTRLPAAALSFAVLVALGAGHVRAALLLEDFEFASSDQAAALGVVDLTDAPNVPAEYISGALENASPQEPNGLYSIGTSAAFCVNIQAPCVPGSFIGFRRSVDAARFTGRCSSGAPFAPLGAAYGDPAQPGTIPRDHDLAQLTVTWDVYGDGGFADGLTGAHLWLRLIDCEGEAFEFINLSEVSLYSEIWTFDVFQGEDIVRLRPESLIDVPQGDRLLTEISVIEVLVQDTDNPPTAVGNWYVDYLRVTEPPPALAGDWDGDGDVDLQDFTGFGVCLQGPGVQAPSACRVLDLDDDTDVDFSDFGQFQARIGVLP